MKLDDYRAALKRGRKTIAQQAPGLSKTLPALDDIIQPMDIQSEVPLGLVDIPADLIAGTKTAGRTGAFAPDFMPLLDEASEFALKWMYLCESHLSEGIREPIKAYEYLNHYYVLEGNKRVSVLKYCGAASIPGYVTRLIPPRSNKKEVKIYYEYLDFYNATNINYLLFTKEGCYQHLCKLLGKKKYERWSYEDRMEFRSSYARFSEAFQKLTSDDLAITASDAMLIYLDIFGKSNLQSAMPGEIQKNLEKIWDEIILAENDHQVSVVMDPEPVPQQRKRLFSRILTPSVAQEHLKIAFIHAKTAATSSWTYSHELGRMYLADIFRDSIETIVFDQISSTKEAVEKMEEAIRQDCQIIFTTTPEFMEASLKVAVEHPEVKILNCSLNESHKYVRTYYGRMYEAKFLTGVLAGAMTDTGKIGYIADYPIYGMTANINAFALGVKMVNPRAKVFLEWSTALENQGVNLTEKFLEHNITFISNQEMIIPNKASRQFGLYRANGETPVNLGCPIWHWGKYYERIIRSIRGGVWEQEESNEMDKAVNYWWGMSAGVVDVIWSPSLPSGTKAMLEVLRQSICNCAFHPFSGIIQAQNGLIQGEENHILSPRDIITMNWLSDNIEGRIPTIQELTKEKQGVVRLEGTNRKEQET